MYGKRQIQTYTVQYTAQLLVAMVCDEQSKCHLPTKVFLHSTIGHLGITLSGWHPCFHNDEHLGSHEHEGNGIEHQEDQEGEWGTVF